MSLGEFDIIARYFTRRLARRDVLLGVGDDAAVLDTPPDRKLVVAMDTIVEGVHFPRETRAEDIGYRVLAVNLSDIAAMGARPVWMTLSLSLPSADERWISGFASGLFELADRYNVALVGGDTVRGPLVATVQIAGWVETDRWLTRAGAKAGDLLFVSGTPGEAAAGLAVIQNRIEGGPSGAWLRRRFLRPEPRLELGRGLRTIVGAAMDVSDGLLTDIGKLCEASDCGAVIDIDALPASPPMRELFDDAACVDYQLGGGDDYELIFTASSDQARDLAQLREAHTFTQIGFITAERGVRCQRHGQSFQTKHSGYDHFKGEPG
jgi:thiamine-monophosphate kinase